jgi:hypothetical protein
MGWGWYNWPSMPITSPMIRRSQIHDSMSYLPPLLQLDNCGGALAIFSGADD